MANNIFASRQMINEKNIDYNPKQLMVGIVFLGLKTCKKINFLAFGAVAKARKVFLMMFIHVFNDTHKELNMIIKFFD